MAGKDPLAADAPQASEVVSHRHQLLEDQRSQQADLETAGSSAAEARPTELAVKARFFHKGSASLPPDAPPDNWEVIELELAGPRGNETCWVHLNKASKGTFWEQTAKGFKLNDTTAEGDIRIPLFTPSRARWETGLLDLSEALGSRSYFHIVGIQQYITTDGTQHDQLDLYKRHWPNLSFFVRPQRPETDSHGASRLWLQRLAAAICTDFPYAFFVDDNVSCWFLRKLVTHDAVFDELMANSDATSLAHVRSVSLAAIFDHFLEEHFVANELPHLSMIGFPKQHPDDKSKHAHARGQVYKAYMVNVKLLAYSDYLETASAWEDLEYNFRISGYERIRGRTDRGRGNWIKRRSEVDIKASLTNEDCQLRSVWTPHQDKPGPAVICKCNHFAFKTDESIPKEHLPKFTSFASLAAAGWTLVQLTAFAVETEGDAAAGSLMRGWLTHGLLAPEVWKFKAFCTGAPAASSPLPAVRGVTSSSSTSSPKKTHYKIPKKPAPAVPAQVQPVPQPPATEDFGRDNGIAHDDGMLSGSVRSWIAERGFGIIVSDSAQGPQEFFCHYKNITDGSALQLGAKVRFSLGFDAVRQRRQAEKVRR